MINIGANRDLDNIAKQYLTRLKKKERRHNGSIAKHFFISQIKDIVLANYNDLSNYLDSPYNSDIDFYNYMINQYTEMCKDHGSWLAEQLNVRVCPYCNRNFTSSINNKKGSTIKTRPEFDHFYSKSKYPLLALSFYNLVPCCHTCNHVKKENRIKVHPYFDAVNTKFEIQSKNSILDNNRLLLLNPTQFKINVVNTSQEDLENIKVFGLKELYNQHKDYVREIMDKTQAYDSHAREALVNSFQGAGNTPEQVYHFVWGQYLTTEEHEKRPLSKLTKDILDQLEIIK